MLTKFDLPSFIKGFGMGIDLGATMQEPIDTRAPEDISNEAISAAWFAVGDALYWAMGSCANERG